MKTYKRIPIPEALYKLVQVYKKNIRLDRKNICFRIRQEALSVMEPSGTRC